MMATEQVFLTRLAGDYCGVLLSLGRFTGDKRTERKIRNLDGVPYLISWRLLWGSSESW